jgi:probable F420-dependent oxidoreductase
MASDPPVPLSTLSPMTSGHQGRAVADRIGRVGLWTTHLHYLPAPVARDEVARIEELGFGALWIGEATGKEALTHAALLLAGAERLVVATGIANIWGRDPLTMANAGRTIEDAYPGRFVLGLGVSHPFLTEPRGRTYEKPLTRMRTYLEAMDEAPFVGPQVDQPPRVLAALGPKMLELARDRAAGAHPYFVPVEHTAKAREILGAGPLLAPEQAVVLDSDADLARAIARRHTTSYLRVDNYRNNLRRLGWDDDELADGGTDRLVDAMVAWGGVEEIAARVRAHLDAGADHVPLRLLVEDPRVGLGRALDEIAATLAGL